MFGAHGSAQMANGTNGIDRRTGKSKTCVWRWQERFAQEGYDGLLRDKTRPSRIPPLGPEVAERVVALTLSEPAEATLHSSIAAMMAKAWSCISVSSVQRIWRAHGPFSAPSGAAIQAFERSRLRRQTESAMWSGSTSTRRPTPSCSLGRRKVADPGESSTAPSPACR